MRLRKFIVMAVALAALPPIDIANAKVTPHLLFTNSAVLQRDASIPIWGVAQDGEEVTVRFANQEKKTVAKSGRWQVKLDPVEAGGPYELTIEGENVVTLKNILVGDVWFCGGQSNMQFELKDADKGAEAIADSSNSNLRCFTVLRWGASEEERALQNKWLVAAPDTAGSFSAVGYFFGRELQRDLDVPIGLINSNYGGTNAEAWMNRESLAAEPEIAARFQSWLKANNNFGGDAGGLFDGMVKSLAPYALRGVIWYQGENNASRAGDYERVLSLLIRDWRAVWGQGDFPFLIVQLPPFGNGENKWADIRAAQMEVAASTPNTATVVTTDVGDAADIHPKNKWPIGQRLALTARAIAYGQEVEHRGPELIEAEFSSGVATLTFDHVGNGLKSKSDTPQGFSIAGADGRYVDADAKITSSNAVVVSSAEVPMPVGVRFAWKDFNEADLWSSSDLPAAPFRSSSLAEVRD